MYLISKLLVTVTKLMIKRGHNITVVQYQSVNHQNL